MWLCYYQGDEQRESEVLLPLLWPRPAWLSSAVPCRCPDPACGSPATASPSTARGQHCSILWDGLFSTNTFATLEMWKGEIIQRWTRWIDGLCAGKWLSERDLQRWSSSPLPGSCAAAWGSWRRRCGETLAQLPPTSSGTLPLWSGCSLQLDAFKCHYWLAIWVINLQKNI